MGFKRHCAGILSRQCLASRQVHHAGNQPEDAGCSRMRWSAHLMVSGRPFRKLMAPQPDPRITTRGLAGSPGWDVDALLGLVSCCGSSCSWRHTEGDRVSQRLAHQKCIGGEVPSKPGSPVLRHAPLLFCADWNMSGLMLDGFDATLWLGLGDVAGNLAIDFGCSGPDDDDSCAWCTFQGFDRSVGAISIARSCRTFILGSNAQPEQQWQGLLSCNYGQHQKLCGRHYCTCFKSCTFAGSCARPLAHDQHWQRGFH